jgi:isoleucyl-tRNA synthetase
LLLSLAGNGAPPYKTVLTHGFMVDADREKISKSKQGQGGYEKPQTAEAYVKKWGADIVRLWVGSQDYRNDIIVSEERINKVAETYRLLRNSLRYQLSNLYDFDPSSHTVPDAQLTGLDRWILEKFSSLEMEVSAAFDRYEFHVVYQKISQFAAVELSAVYHDLVKDRLYTDPASSLRRRSTQTAVYRLLTGLCKMLSPFLAFTSDEAWELIPGRPEGESVHETDWVPAPFVRSIQEREVWETLFGVREKALFALEEARRAKQIGKALDAHLKILYPPEASGQETTRVIQSHLREFQEILNVSRVSLEPLAQGGELQFSVMPAEGTKCARCWHFETDVGVTPEHPAICGRCVEAVS